MATRKQAWLSGLVIALAWWCESASGQSLERFTYSEPHLGTIVEFTLYAPSETVANEAARSGFARIKELDLIFSDYKPDSEAMQLCTLAGSGQAKKVSPELFQVLKQSLIISEQTGGAFDVTIGPLVQLWRKARKEKRLPTPEAIAAAKQRVDWKLIVLNEADQTAELKRAGMKLDFGGIAKGYIAQEVRRRLAEQGITRTLIALSGDIVAGERPPTAEGWKVAVSPLTQDGQTKGRLLRLENQAVSTSGDRYQYVEIAGTRYSHVVDPRSGQALTHRCSVTVVSNDATFSDAADTAIYVLGAEAGLKFIEQYKNAEAIIVEATADRFETRETKGFSRLEER